jgi:hypothetical protein
MAFPHAAEPPCWGMPLASRHASPPTKPGGSRRPHHRPPSPPRRRPAARSPRVGATGAPWEARPSPPGPRSPSTRRSRPAHASGPALRWTGAGRTPAGSRATSGRRGSGDAARTGIARCPGADRWRRSSRRGSGPCGDPGPEGRRSPGAARAACGSSPWALRLDHDKGARRRTSSVQLLDIFQNMADVELRTPDGRTATLTDER